MMHAPQIILIVLFTAHTTLNLVGIINPRTIQDQKFSNTASIVISSIFMAVVNLGRLLLSIISHMKTLKNTKRLADDEDEDDSA